MERLIMWKLISLSLLFLILISSSTLGQEKRNKAKAVIIPSEIYMPTIVAQPDCPLKIEKAFVGKMLDGPEQMFFQARNMGSKSIISFQIDMIGTNGGGQTSLFPY